MTDREKLLEELLSASKQMVLDESWPVTEDELVKYHSSSFEFGFACGALWCKNYLPEDPISSVWHDVSETPSIFGTYLLIHEGGWCVARYFGKEVPTGNTTGWVEISENIFVEHPQKWLDLRDVLPKTK